MSWELKNILSFQSYWHILHFWLHVIKQKHSSSGSFTNFCEGIFAEVFYRRFHTQCQYFYKYIFFTWFFSCTLFWIFTKFHYLFHQFLLVSTIKHSAFVLYAKRSIQGCFHMPNSMAIDLLYEFFWCQGGK